MSSFDRHGVVGIYSSPDAEGQEALLRVGETQERDGARDSSGTAICGAVTPCTCM